MLGLANLPLPWLRALTGSDAATLRVIGVGFGNLAVALAKSEITLCRWKETRRKEKLKLLHCCETMYLELSDVLLIMLLEAPVNTKSQVPYWNFKCMGPIYRSIRLYVPHISKPQSQP